MLTRLPIRNPLQVCLINDLLNSWFLFPTLLTLIEQCVILWTFMTPDFVTSPWNRPLLLQCWMTKWRECYKWKSFSRCPASPHSRSFDLSAYAAYLSICSNGGHCNCAQSRLIRTHPATASGHRRPSLLFARAHMSWLLTCRVTVCIGISDLHLAEIDQ